MNFKLAMSLKELRKRTSKQHYKKVELLKPDSREVKSLTKDELLTLMHLTRAANQIEKVNLKLENHFNIEFLEFLNNEILNGNEKAVLSKKLFLSQKSMFSFDMNGEKTALVKNLDESLGMGYFPTDLSENEFHKILNRMIDDGEFEEVRKILSQRTVVKRNGEKLKAIDFIDEFKKEFKIMADELNLAAQYCDDKKFKKYLEVQAKALQVVDEKYDAEADILWAKLKGKYEFTICRECYTEKLTQTIFNNIDLLNKLNQHKIKVHAKDSLGARVGIVNKRGTHLLNKLQNLIKVASEFMPYSDEYENNFKNDNIYQNAVDVDIVTLTGEEGAYQAGLVLAQNLPNDDKAWVKQSGRRNVYHRQVRKNVNKKLYKNLICEEQFKYFNPEADHWAVICHENTHSLGPNSHSSLGIYAPILEEYKADLGMYAFLDEFVDAKYFSDEQIKQIMVTSLSYSFIKGKPDLSQAHRTRSVMICNRLLKEKAIEIVGDVKLKFNFNKIKEITKKMMEEVIRIQIDGDVKKAENYILKWNEWTNEISEIAEKIKKYSKTLNGYLCEPLADEFLKPDYEFTLNNK